jgi:hypothetical protein
VCAAPPTWGRHPQTFTKAVLPAWGATLEKADVRGERFARARSVCLFLRQARLATAIKEMLDIFGALEVRQLPLRAIDRVLRIDPQCLGGLCVGLIELPECASARGPGADRRRKRLIDLDSVGAMFGAVSHAAAAYPGKIGL